MNKAGFLFLGAMISAGSFLFAGCGPDTSGTTGGAGGESAVSSSSGGPSSSSGGPASSSSGGTPTAATVDSYCKASLANCTAANAQYADVATCTAVAKSFAQGDVGAMAGNSLECRAYHAGTPSMTTPAMHCGHSGITGGDLDPSATGTGNDGPCGDGVEAFCKLAVATCTGANVVWADEAACVTDAKQFPKSATQFSTKDTAGDTFNCRAYHLTVATQDAATHCKHIALVSATCK
jgi:hypothetical protein